MRGRFSTRLSRACHVRAMCGAGQDACQNKLMHARTSLCMREQAHAHTWRRWHALGQVNKTELMGAISLWYSYVEEAEEEARRNACCRVM